MALPAVVGKDDGHYHCLIAIGVLMRMIIDSVRSMNPRVVRRYDSWSLHKGTDTECHRIDCCFDCDVDYCVPIAVWIDVPIVEGIEQSREVRERVGVLHVVGSLCTAVYP